MNSEINPIEAMQAVGLNPIVLNTPADVEKKLGAVLSPADRAAADLAKRQAAADQETDFWQGAPVISSYSRAQAIEDGVLVDLLQFDDLRALVLEAGFKYPMAMTVGAFSTAIAPIDGELPAGQDVKGRLWDLLMVFKAAIQSSRGPGDRIDFSLSVWDGQRHNKVDLYALCGPGDTTEPVITIMLPWED